MCEMLKYRVRLGKLSRGTCTEFTPDLEKSYVSNLIPYSSRHSFLAFLYEHFEDLFRLISIPSLLPFLTWQFMRGFCSAASHLFP